MELLPYKKTASHQGVQRMKNGLLARCNFSVRSLADHCLTSKSIFYFQGLSMGMVTDL